MRGDPEIISVSIDKYCGTRTGQPYMGAVSAMWWGTLREYPLEIKFNHKYEIEKGAFVLDKWSLSESGDDFYRGPYNPVIGVIVGRGIGIHPELCTKIEEHFREIFDSQMKKGPVKEKKEASSSLPQSSSELSPELQTSCSQ